jgi:hypothetical protein
MCSRFSLASISMMRFTRATEGLSLWTPSCAICVHRLAIENFDANTNQVDQMAYGRFEDIFHHLVPRWSPANKLQA